MGIIGSNIRRCDIYWDRTYFSHLAVIEIGAARTIVVGSFSPAFSLLFAAVFLKEELNP